MRGKDYLFVYGTLRNGFDLKLKNRVADELEYVGRAKLSASLYDIGNYPGAIREGENSEVIGEVFLVNNSEKVFLLLDKYEGKEFQRKKAKVTLRNGRPVNAWVYWYNQKPEGKTKIFYKDYFNYLKFKKTA